MLFRSPEWVPTAPYLALPSLTAVLRQNGHEVVQKDVNIEMYDHFFTDTFLIWVMARMSTQRRALAAREAAGGLTEREEAQKACLDAAAAVDVIELAAHVPIDIDLFVVQAGEDLLRDARPVAEITLHRIEDERGRIVGGRDVLHDLTEGI